MAEQKPRAIRLVEDRWATVRHVVEVLALVAAGVWAFYVVIYQERIKPAGEPAALNDTITIERIGQDRTRDVLDVAMHLHNYGKTEIEVAADGYNLWGDRYATTVTQSSTGSAGELAGRSVGNDYALVSRRLIHAFLELRQDAVGGYSHKNTTIEPDGVITISQVVVIPRGRYDVLHAQIFAVPVKTPVRHRVAVQVIHQSDGSFFLHATTPGVYEDDNGVDFGLLPD
ncbi:MAG TPA: hypothetical protein VF741_01005 [Candidatus Aquilonibacter sp.]